MAVRRKQIKRRTQSVSGGTLKKLALQRGQLAKAVKKQQKIAQQATAALSTAEQAIANFDSTLRSLAGGLPKTRTPVVARKTAATGKAAKQKPVRRRARRKAGQPTQAEALTAVIGKSQGIKISDAIAAVQKEYGITLKKTSASTQLSSLKKAGRVRNDASGWHMIKTGTSSG